MTKPITILIGGHTCCSKEQLLSKIKEQYGEEKVAVLNDIFFYRPGSEGTSEKRNKRDRSEEVDKEAFFTAIKNLQAKKDISFPIHRRRFDRWNEKNLIAGRIPEKITKIIDTGEVREIKAKDIKIIALDGKRLLNQGMITELWDMSDLIIFADADPSFRLIWKMMRSPYWKEWEGKPAKSRRNFGWSKHKGDKGFVESVVSGFDTWRRVRIKEKERDERFKSFCEKDSEKPALYLFNNSWEQLEKTSQKLIDYIDLYFQNQERFKTEIAKERAKIQSQTPSKIQVSEREREREQFIGWLGWELS